MADCVFCRIITGDEPARIVQADHQVITFHPLNPVTPGHLLFVPTVHVADFAERPEVTATVMRSAAMFADLHVAANLITSKGSAATQTIHHLHVHLVPRRPDDGLHLPWTVNRGEATA